MQQEISNTANYHEVLNDDNTLLLPPLGDNILMQHIYAVTAYFYISYIIPRSVIRTLPLRTFKTLNKSFVDFFFLINITLLYFLMIKIANAT